MFSCLETKYVDVSINETPESSVGKKAEECKMSNIPPLA